jgi:predicted alpha/beta-fold hydrolase
MAGTVLDSSFVPDPLVRGGHAQTVVAATLRRAPEIPWRWERLELPDGDFVDLAWHGPAPGDGPLVLLLHGLAGGAASPYIRDHAAAFAAAGVPVVLLCFRGCSGEPNRLPRGYHSGETGDAAHVLEELRARHPGASLRAVGFSLGGNVLLKYLGERGEAAAVDAAVAVSVPLELGPCSRKLSEGFSRIYRLHLLRKLRDGVRAKRAVLEGHVDVGAVLAAGDFEAFDGHLTAPLHGFDSAEDYYTRCSSRQFLRAIARPTLVVQAVDDPFMPPSVLPGAEELSAQVTLERSARGGHVGFLGPGRRPWLPGRVLGWLATR